MANSDKNIVITPNKGSSTDDPKIAFTGADSNSSNTITMRAYNTSNGTLSVDGSAGQLFSITNQLTGTIFSVNDVSGMPAIEVYDTGKTKLTGGMIPRIYSTSTTSSLVINSDLYDTYIITAQTSNLTIGADIGTPYDGQRIIMRIKNGSGSTAYTITWNSIYRAIGITLPTSMTASYLYYFGFVYNALSNKWDAIALKQASV